MAKSTEPAYPANFFSYVFDENDLDRFVFKRCDRCSQVCYFYKFSGGENGFYIRNFATFDQLIGARCIVQ